MDTTTHLLPDGFPLEANAPFAEAHHLLSKFFEETSHLPYVCGVKAQDYSSGREILAHKGRDDVSMAYAALQRLEWLLRDSDGFWQSWYGSSKRHNADSVQVVLNALFRRRLPITSEDAEQVTVACVDLFRADSSAPRSWVLLHWLPVSGLVRNLEWASENAPLAEGATAALERLNRILRSPDVYDKEYQKLAERIDLLLGRERDPLVLSGDAWADAARLRLETMPAKRRQVWISLLSHAATADGSKPSAKWLATGEPDRVAIGRDEFAQCVTDWMNRVVPPPPLEARAPDYPTGDDLVANRSAMAQYHDACQSYYVAVREYTERISEKNIAMLKGLAWCSADIPSADLARALGRMTEMAFHSVRERGPWASRAGNAAIWALGQMPGGVGVGPLARLRTKLRDRGALKLIAAGIESAAAQAGMTVDALEDLAVPTGGLDADGTRHEAFGETGGATLTLDAATGRTAIEWLGADGKPRKAVPAAVKKEFGAEVKALKAAEDEIRQALGAQSARLDRALLDERTWTGAEWCERYLSHPVLGSLARRLLWTFDGTPGLPAGEGIVGADGRARPLPADEATVRLWHPIGHEPLEVLRWRDALEARGTVQPFKQAHREVYLLTDAERNTRTYSNRFAAHILKQHQFNGLAVLRGWKNSLRLMVDDSYPPATKLLPRHNLRAEFWVEGIGDDYGTDTNEAGTYLRLATDQVRFYALDAPVNYAHAGGGGYAPYRAAGVAEPLPLDQIPPLVLSETMRDVDLFVGVASLGNDPNWADGGPQGRFRDYWQEYSFGDLTETAKTRADVLGRLLPRLKIADRCRLDGRFLVVRGDVRTYKIHLGSGNILMEPNDQYLCIVPKAGADEGGGGLMLPFEGDRTLSVIVSKAFLLAGDTKITDPTITRQIGVH